MGELKIFAGSAGVALGQRICEYLNIAPGKAIIDHFPDGETLLKLDDDVRGKDCFVVQPTSPPVNDNLVQLLIFIDCLRRASANRITAVIPYYGYARQDRKSEGRTPITAKLVANMIVEAGAHRVLAMHLHADQIQGFFDVPLDHLSSAPVIAGHFKKLRLDNIALVSPDVGNIKTANEYGQRLGGDLVVIDKRRTAADSTIAAHIIGEVEGKTVLMFDDMITTGGTVVEAVKLLKRHGCGDIYVAATHAVFAGPCIQRLRSVPIEQICVTDTIPLSPEVSATLKNLKVLSVASLIGEAIRRIHEHQSVSALFS
ncbi:MAG TPA: ribose-phosphate pyrophosphokinase [Phycisphaerae bacterium]